ncbi:hypothetical protein [Mycobacterium sp.]|jgi:hypothetical protein|uniref:hypothetical protein n=1 Tax=Mycobacterium sp. TaxID=1785 RepID=UPI002D44715B|nr:hypothetical protein [Mycobacterium sp.]HZA10708.1 hypothetical protein [Mycobacterium sp.]
MSLKPAYFAAGWIAAQAAAAISLAPVVAADPVWPIAGAESASATIADLRAQGYDVQINWVNGKTTTPLWLCRVTWINNPDRSPGSEATFTTVYVDVVCPHDDRGGIFGFGIG